MPLSLDGDSARAQGPWRGVRPHVILAASVAVGALMSGTTVG
jgi:hypothetical protein